ncbi:MAG: hypothetical protein V1856_01685, partial [Candidatus Liptonbacteria bacterium]
PEDFSFYERIKVPPPTFCPECRLQRRIMFRNERNLYKRDCDLCGKPSFSTFSADKRRPVYCPKCWWSDDWNVMEYGRDYDPNKNFLEQFAELFSSVPAAALGNNQPTLVNSDYVNEVGYCKNCYLIFDADYCENVMYSTMRTNDKDSSDCYILGESELCYGNVNCRKCQKVFFTENSTDCYDVYFSRNLVGCSNCFGCTNMRNKSYHIWNRPYPKEEYQRLVADYVAKMSTRSGLRKLKKQTQDFFLKNPNRYMQGLMNKNVSGDYVYESKNAINCFRGRGIQDCKYCQFLKDETTKDSYDYTIWGGGAELVYDSMDVGIGISGIRFSSVCALSARDCDYSIWCLGSADLFGCMGLRNKKYCILNKQYEREEYFKLRERIITDMMINPYVDRLGRIWRYGEFMPYDLFPYAYNETMAMEHFPLSKEEVIASGWKWKEPEPSKYQPEAKAKDLPEDIGEVRDGILEKIVECGSCGKAYRFISPELELLRKFGIALPEECSECRHFARMGRMTLLKLWNRSCDCVGETSKDGAYKNILPHAHGRSACGKEFQTAFSPERPEIVYCEECYQQEMA